MLISSDAHYDSDSGRFSRTIVYKSANHRLLKIKAMCSVWYELRKFSPDMVIIDLPQRLPTMILSFFLVRRYQTLITIHDAEPHDESDVIHFLIGSLQKKLINNGMGIITFSNYSKNLLSIRHSKKPIYVVPLLPEAPSDFKYVSPSGRSGFAMIGRWSEYKGFDIGIEIWNKYVRETGSSESLDLWCSGLSTAHDYGPRINWKSYSSFDWSDLLQQLSKYHAVLMPYRSASQSGVQVLAWTFGVTCIVSSAPGLKEYQPDWMQPIPLHSIDLWVECIASLQDDERANQLGRKGQEFMETVNSVDRIVDALTLCLTDVKVRQR